MPHLRELNCESSSAHITQEGWQTRCQALYVFPIRCSVNATSASRRWGRFAADRALYGPAMAYHNPPFESLSLEHALGLAVAQALEQRCVVLVAPRWFKPRDHHPLAKLKCRDLLVYWNCPAVLARQAELRDFGLRGMRRPFELRELHVQSARRWRNSVFIINHHYPLKD